MVQKIRFRIAITNKDELYFLWKAGVLPSELMTKETYNQEPTIIGCLVRNTPFSMIVKYRETYKSVWLFSTSEILLSYCEDLLEKRDPSKVLSLLKNMLAKKDDAPSKHICNTCVMSPECNKKCASNYCLTYVPKSDYGVPPYFN